MDNTRKFYKALLKEPYMTSKYGNMKYELGKTYKLPKTQKIEFGKIGYHYTDNPFIIPLWYFGVNYDIFEVIPEGEIAKDDIIHKYCASEITIIRKVEESELKNLEYLIDELIDSPDKEVRILAANAGYKLDVLINDTSSFVRAAVAKRRYGLDILINDTSPSVRCEVARQGYGFDILINDTSPSVRCEVASQRYGLDILINDPDPAIRYEVASLGYGLDKLINDPEPAIRYEVAKQGYGLMVLKDDPVERVRKVARSIINKRVEQCKDATYTTTIGHEEGNL